MSNAFSTLLDNIAQATKLQSNDMSHLSNGRLHRSNDNSSIK